MPRVAGSMRTGTSAASSTLRLRVLTIIVAPQQGAGAVPVWSVVIPVEADPLDQPLGRVVGVDCAQLGLDRGRGIQLIRIADRPDVAVHGAGMAVHQSGHQHAARRVLLYRPLRRAHAGCADLDDGTSLEDQDAGLDHRRDQAWWRPGKARSSSRAADGASRNAAIASTARRLRRCAARRPLRSPTAPQPSIVPRQRALFLLLDAELFQDRGPSVDARLNVWNEAVAAATENNGTVCCAATWCRSGANRAGSTPCARRRSC